MKIPQISIIMPVYNAVATVRRMVDSIIVQTFNDWELIAVDDGSTDGSGDILDIYGRSDSRIRVIHKSNRGVASARQAGMELARGIYTIHADSDDYVEPTMLEDMYSLAIEDDADIVIADYFTECLDGQTHYVAQRLKSYENIEVLKALYAKGLFGGLWHKLIKKSAYEKAQAAFIPGIDYCEDMLVLTKIIARGNPKIVYLPRAYYHYIQNPNSLTRRVSAKGLQSMKRFHSEASKILFRDESFRFVVDSFPVYEFLVMFSNRLYTDKKELQRELSTVYPLLVDQRYGIRWRLGFWCIRLGFVNVAHQLIKL